MIKRTITLEMHDGSNWTVREGDRYADRLCWDEMLGTVAELTHPAIGTGRYRMDGTAQHVRRHEKHEARMAELQAAEDESIF